MLMKKNILLYMAAVAGLVLAGCNKTEAPEAGSLNMTVKASIGDQTKVAYDGVSTTFQTGDQLAVWAWTGESDVLPQTFVVDDIVNTLDESGKWVPATQMLWKNVKDEHYFLAVHPVPAMAIANLSAVPYAVDNTNYEASDLLLANELTGLKAAAKTVDLTFSHAMAKLQVNLKFRNQFGPGGPAPESVTAALVGKGTAAVNYLTKVVTPTGDEVSVEMAPIATEEGYMMSFAGIQIPQNATKIDVTVGKTIFSYTHPEPLPIQPGKFTTLGFIVGQDVITLESVSVDPWVFDEPLTGGEAEFYIPPKNAAQATAEDVGKVIGADGNIYDNAGAATKAGTSARAIIAYVGEAGSVDFVSETYKGLAIALSDADGDMCTWADENDGLYYCLSSSVDVDLDAALNLINGKTCTETLNNPYHTDHNHVAASFAKENKDTPRPDAASDWFLPSMGQWNLIVQGLATKKAGSAVTTDLTKSNNDTYKASNLNSVITAAGGEGFKEYDYWSSTEYDDVGAWCINFGSGKAAKYAKASDCYVRSAFAF